jgi:Adaptive response protein AidB N-terminal domain
MGDLAISERVLTYVADAEKNVPYLKTWDTFGKRKDEPVTSEGWRRLQEIGIQEGMVAIPYEQKSGPYSRVHQFLKSVLLLVAFEGPLIISGTISGPAAVHQ